jgi:hypothetical protein
VLTSDGLTRAQFMPLWRDAMLFAVDEGERCRLVLQLGRAGAKEDGHADPLLVAVTDDREQPLTVLPLLDLPSATRAPQVRSGVQERLAELGATEVYVLATLQGPNDALLLVAWGETVSGCERCQLLAYRKQGDRIEEAQVLVAPDPSLTEISRQCKGLLTPRH